MGVASLAVVAAAIEAGCQGSCKPDLDADPDRTLVLGTTQEPATLDPVLSALAGEQAIVRLLFAGLTSFDDQARVVPRLAQGRPRVRTSSTGSQLAFWKLRDGLRWSDGAPITSRDVVFGHEVESDPQVPSLNRAVAENVLAIDPIDARRFVVRWRGPYRGFDHPRVHAVLPEHVYPRGPTSGALGLGRNPGASSGPYRMVRWDAGQRLILEPNPYWAGLEPWFERIVFRFFLDGSAFETELRTGGLDALGPASGLGIDQARRLARGLESTHELVTTPSGLLLHLSLRLDHPWLADRAARHLINRVIDRKRMAELVYGGLAQPAYGLYAPPHPAHRAALGNPEEQSGQQDPPPPKDPITLAFATGGGASERAAVYLRAVFAEVGVKVDVKAVPMRVLSSRLRSRKQAPLTLFALRTRPDWAGRAMLRTGGHLNYSSYANARVDALLEEASRTRTVEAWVSTLHRVEDMVQKDLPVIPLLFRNDVSLRPRGLSGWRPTGTTTPITWNAESWRR